MKTKKARTCAGCWAYNDHNSFTGYCSLGFDVEQLEKGSRHAGRMGAGMYWAFVCKPAEPCYKPLTSSQYVEAMKLAHNID